MMTNTNIFSPESISGSILCIFLRSFCEQLVPKKISFEITWPLKPPRKFYKTWMKQWIPVTIFIDLPAETLSRKQPFQMTEPECHPFQFSVMNYYRKYVLKKFEILHSMLRATLNKKLGSVKRLPLWQYGLWSFQVGVQNLKDFYIRIDIPKGNYWILSFGLVASCQKEGIILVIKNFKD